MSDSPKEKNGSEPTDVKAVHEPGNQTNAASPVASDDENARPQQRGRPFKKGASGNPKGRPPGARNRASLIVQALLEGRAEGLAQKAVELALKGDKSMLQYCLARVVPPCREAAVSVDLPPLNSPARCREAIGAVIQAAAKGEITLAAAIALVELINTHRLGFDYTGSEPDFEKREADRHLKRLLLLYPPGAAPPEDEGRWREFQKELEELDLPLEQEARLSAEGVAEILSEESYERLFDAEDDGDGQGDDKGG